MTPRRKRYFRLQRRPKSSIRGQSPALDRISDDAPALLRMVCGPLVRESSATVAESLRQNLATWLRLARIDRRPDRADTANRAIGPSHLDRGCRRAHDHAQSDVGRLRSIFTNKT